MILVHAVPNFRSFPREAGIQLGPRLRADERINS
jgi:hypothetical protein